MGEIGRRAAAEIRRTAAENDTSITFELECCGLYRELLHRWEKKPYEPTGEKLKGLALAGYDVHYILTGERK